MNIEEAIDILVPKENIDLSNHFNNTRFFEAIYTLLTAYEKEKEKNMELTNSYNQAIKETNEENRRCMLLAVENQDLKEGFKIQEHNYQVAKEEIEQRWKDKIKAKIEEYKEKCKKCNFRGKICEEFTKNYECTIGACLKEFYSLLEKG